MGNHFNILRWSRSCAASISSLDEFKSYFTALHISWVSPTFTVCLHSHSTNSKVEDVDCWALKMKILKIFLWDINFLSFHLGYNVKWHSIKARSFYPRKHKKKCIKQWDLPFTRRLTLTHPIYSRQQKLVSTLVH